MRFKSHMQKFDFAGKTPAEIKQHYLEKTKGDVAHAYNLLSNAIVAVYREPDIKRAMQNALQSLHTDYHEKKEPVDKWKEFEDHLKRHDWHYEMTDDPGVRRRGEDSYRKVRAHAAEMMKLDREKALELIHKHVPADKITKK